MLRETSGYAEKGPIGKAEKCRPDYESMIKRISVQLGKTKSFRDAALAYFEGRSANGKMAELIGELVTETASLEREHASLIEAQENDPAV